MNTPWEIKNMTLTDNTLYMTAVVDVILFDNKKI